MPGLWRGHKLGLDLGFLPEIQPGPEPGLGLGLGLRHALERTGFSVETLNLGLGLGLTLMLMFVLEFWNVCEHRRGFGRPHGLELEL